MTAPPADGPTLVDVLVGQARMEAKMDMLVTSSQDQDSRIRALESNRWPARSIATICGVIGACSSFLGAMWMR